MGSCGRRASCVLPLLGSAGSPDVSPAPTCKQQGRSILRCQAEGKMAIFCVLLLLLLQCCFFSYGAASYSVTYFSHFNLKHMPQEKTSIPSVPSHNASPPSANLASAPSASHKLRHITPLGSRKSPALLPKYRGLIPGSRAYGHHHHHHNVPRRAHSPSFIPNHGQDCSDIPCAEPMTSTPIGSPCGCVLPMKVELDLGVAPFHVFTVVPELEVEVAAGTYVKQSQVKIMAATAFGQEKTRVDIDLVPLGEKFDMMTALLIYERFWQKKVPINASMFGNYDVIYVRYPGLPSSPPNAPGYSAFGPAQLPLTANVPLGKNQKINSRTIAILALSVVILVLLCVGVACILSRWRTVDRHSTVCSAFTPSTIKRPGMRSIISSSLTSSTALSLVSTMATCPPSVKTFTLADLESATDSFCSKGVLGEGGFGRVYHGIMEDGTEVAVKMLTREDQNGDKEFIAEVEMLSRLHHRNLVKLIGICIDGFTRCLVYELVRNGSVESHLHGVDKKREPLHWDARMKIALGAARGLAYLHEDSNPRVIHRDFKASNILLEDDFTPKVSDFGLAREASEGSNHISTRVMGTFGYVAPEYAMTGHLLVKSDVYSYGVVLLELLSGRKPVDMSQPQGQENLVTWARPLLVSKEGLGQLVDPFLEGNIDFDNMAKVAAIASMCVHPEVSQRPFMGEVVQALKLIYNDIDENHEDSCSQKEGSSAPDCDFRGDGGTGSSWWNAGTPRLTYGYASSFVTMEYSSGPLYEMGHPHSANSFVERAESLTRLNRSGPLQAIHHKPAFVRLRGGSMSEHGLLSRHFPTDGYWI